MAYLPTQATQATLTCYLLLITSLPGLPGGGCDRNKQAMQAKQVQTSPTSQMDRR